MRHCTAADIDLTVKIPKTPRIRRPSRTAAPADFLGGSGRDGRNEYHITPGLAVEAASDICDLASVGPDLWVAQCRDTENRIDGPRLRRAHGAGTRGKNRQQTKPGFP